MATQKNPNSFTGEYYTCKLHSTNFHFPRIAGSRVLSTVWARLSCRPSVQLIRPAQPCSRRQHSPAFLPWRIRIARAHCRGEHDDGGKRRLKLAHQQVPLRLLKAAHQQQQPSPEEKRHRRPPCRASTRPSSSSDWRAVGTAAAGARPASWRGVGSLRHGATVRKVVPLGIKSQLRSSGLCRGLGDRAA